MKQVLSLFGDILMLLAAFSLSRGIAASADHCWPGWLGDLKLYFDVLLLVLVYVVTFYRQGLYKSRRLCTRLSIVSDVFYASLLASLIYISISFLAGLREPSRNEALIFLGLSTGLLMGYRMVLCYLDRGKRKKDKYHILVIGSRARAREVIENILDQAGEEAHIMGCLDISSGLVGKKVSRGVKVIGTMNEYRDYLLDKVVDEVIFAMPLALLNNAPDYLAFADELGVNVRVLPNWQLFEMSYFPRNAIMMFDLSAGFPSLALSSAPRHAGQLMLKEVTDLVGALTLIILLSPVMLVIAGAVKFSSPGPVLFRQTRMGLNGRKFTIFKFRTMYENSDAMKEDLKYLNEQDGPAFKIENDPRITPVGKFLRKTSLDELPQLFNVLRGEMSLVGPRPPLPEEVSLYEPWHRRRLAMKPGLTCVWQVYARNRVDFDSWMRLDLMYIDNWSYFLDVKLLIKTIPIIFRLTGR